MPVTRLTLPAAAAAAQQRNGPRQARDFAQLLDQDREREVPVDQPGCANPGMACPPFAPRCEAPPAAGAGSAALQWPRSVAEADPVAAKPGKALETGIGMEDAGLMPAAPAKPANAGFRVESLATYLAPAAVPGEAAPLPPVKVLRIVLNPETLGEITLSLKLRGAELHVDIVTQTGRAAEVLRQDRSMLEQAISAAGYDAATLTLHAASEIAAPPASPAIAAHSHPQPGRERPNPQNTPRAWSDPDADPEPDAKPRRPLTGVFL